DHATERDDFTHNDLFKSIPVSEHLSVSPEIHEVILPTRSGSISHKILLSDVIPGIRGRDERMRLGPSSRSIADRTAPNVHVQDSSFVIADN
nr:hypothetical protein [Tanacetum cinerariifolium]